MPLAGRAPALACTLVCEGLCAGLGGVLTAIFFSAMEGLARLPMPGMSNANGSLLLAMIICVLDADVRRFFEARAAGQTGLD